LYRIALYNKVIYISTFAFLLEFIRYSKFLENRLIAITLEKIFRELATSLIKLHQKSGGGESGKSDSKTLQPRRTMEVHHEEFCFSFFCPGLSPDWLFVRRWEFWFWRNAVREAVVRRRQRVHHRCVRLGYFRVLAHAWWI